MGQILGLLRGHAQEWTRGHGVAPGLFAPGLASADQAQEQPRLAQSHFFFNPLNSDALGPAPAALGRNHETVALAQQGFGLFAGGAGFVIWLAVDLAGAAGRPVFADACLMPKADGARNFSQCDSMLIGQKCSANTFPYIEVQNKSAKVEHEATTSKIGEEQLFYFQQRGIPAEDAISMIINGFCKDVFRELPMEFAVEATRLLSLKLEGSVG